MKPVFVRYDNKTGNAKWYWRVEHGPFESRADAEDAMNAAKITEAAEKRNSFRIVPRTLERHARRCTIPTNRDSE